jgi:hypothetical protein
MRARPRMRDKNAGKIRGQTKNAGTDGTLPNFTGLVHPYGQASREVAPPFPRSVRKGGIADASTLFAFVA